MGFRTDAPPAATGRARFSRGSRGGRQYLVLSTLLSVLLLGACSSAGGDTPNNGSGASASGTSATGPGTFGGGDKAKGTDIGLTATQIRIGVIADVQTSVAPGLFQKSVNAVNAWADLVNANGGLAGRKVVVDFIDSKHDATDARTAVIAACSRDFALVGTEALNLSTVSDIDGCKNAQGQAIGIPNLAGIALGPQQCDKDTYSAQQNDPAYCATQSAKTPSHTEQVGDTKWLMSQNPGLHGIFMYNTDVPAIEPTQIAQFNAAVKQGIKKDGAGYYGAALSDPQSALTPVEQAIKRYGSTYVSNAVGPGNLVLMKREALLQGVHSVKTWICGANCYADTFIQQGGSAVEGVYDTLPTVPFYSEYASNPALNSLVQKLGGVDNIDANALSSYIEALLFQDAVVKAAATGTLNRQTLFTALSNDATAFTAQGIIGATNVSKHDPSPCFVIAQVQNGKWERAYPAKPGSFDCNPGNLVVSK